MTIEDHKHLHVRAWKMCIVQLPRKWFGITTVI